MLAASRARKQNEYEDLRERTAARAHGYSLARKALIVLKDFLRRRQILKQAGQFYGAVIMRKHFKLWLAAYKARESAPSEEECQVINVVTKSESFR